MKLSKLFLLYIVWLILNAPIGLYIIQRYTQRLSNHGMGYFIFLACIITCVYLIPYNVVIYLLLALLRWL